MNSKKITILITGALLLKSFLFLYASVNAPELKIQTDSHVYLESSYALAKKGVFGKTYPDGSFAFQYYRTPGYPLFLALFHGILKIPLNGIVFLQILLTIGSAMIILKAANTINPRLGIIAFFIILFDPAITVHSLMLLTESLYLFLMCCFVYLFVVYIKNRRKRDLFFSALLLVAATYVRPITFYLGGFLAPFIFWFNDPKNLKKGIQHLCIFVITVYSLLFLWQLRNYNHFQQYKFSNINNATINSQGLYKSYERNTDPISANLPPAAYYLNVGSRNLMSLMTRPVSFKYFGSDVLKKWAKLFSYPWIAFWLIGLLVGAFKTGKNVSFHFMLIVVFYLGAATILGAMWGAGARFRIPMMPFIAILSSYGWLQLKEKFYN